MNKKYEDCTIRFNLSPNGVNGDLVQAQQMLNKFGVELNVIGSTAVLHINSDNYTREKTRHAGNTFKAAFKDNGELVTYGDVLYWNRGQGIVWDEIVALTGLSRASFYRRKKAMESSTFYQKLMDELDWSQVRDESYWKSLKYADTLF